MALRYLEAGGGAGGIGSAKALLRQQRWSKESAVARLMEALVQSAPEALRHERGKTSAAAQFPEFRAWHALLDPLFGIAPPDWTEKPQKIMELPLTYRSERKLDEDIAEEEEGDQEGEE
jgi:putative DNA methylase